MRDVCHHCHKRKATVNWVGKGGMLDFAHGFYERWCNYCATEAQLKNAKWMAKLLPTRIKRLEKKLARLSRI